MQNTINTGFPSEEREAFPFLDLKVMTETTYSKPEVFFSSFMLFSGTLLPLNHFLVAENNDRLKPFLDISCKETMNYEYYMAKRNINIS